MAFPLFAWKILAVGLAKKATVYVLGRLYGFPRMYRRFIEFQRWRAVDVVKRKKRQEWVKWVFRGPNSFLLWFRGRRR